MPDQNTIVSILYRDASNYKNTTEVRVSGTLTQDQIGRITACLDDGEYFIPERVGLKVQRWNKFDPELDHKWCELNASSFEATNLPADTSITAEELVRRFEALKGCWENAAKTFDWELPLPDELR